MLGVSFSGELAYEIHVPNFALYAAYLALHTAGEAFGMQIFGARAVESMRLEKGFLHWKSDLLTEFDPFETGLDRFVRMDKPDFVGKAALQQRLETGPSKKLVSLQVGCKHAPAHAGASVRDKGAIVGSIASAAWGHRVGMNLAYAFVDPKCADVGTGLTVDVIGAEIPATVIAPGPYDPQHERMRS